MSYNNVGNRPMQKTHIKNPNITNLQRRALNETRGHIVDPNPYSCISLWEVDMDTKENASRLCSVHRTEAGGLEG